MFIDLQSLFLTTINLLKSVVYKKNAESTSAVSIVLSSGDAENVTVRSTVLLVCVAYGNPAPTVNWQYDRGSNRNSVNFSVTNDTSIRVRECVGHSIATIRTYDHDYSLTLALSNNVCTTTQDTTLLILCKGVGYL